MGGWVGGRVGGWVDGWGSAKKQLASRPRVYLVDVGRAAKNEILAVVWGFPTKPQ